MSKTHIAETTAKINQLGRSRKPFLFVLDYELDNCLVLATDDIPNHIHYSINGVGNAVVNSPLPKPLHLKPYPLDYCEYEAAYKVAMGHIRYGNSFLLNLTFPTPVDINASLTEIYRASTAKYKLLIEDELVVFSPEIFMQISQGRISSHPMKGTIDASLPDAYRQLLVDEKETAEHATIVDLLRNDLSMVASDVRVERYRYLERLSTSGKSLYQTSSHITGTLSDDYEDHLGDIIMRLLPAGSISGAPKAKTVEVIAEAEGQTRGYYTGVMGHYDGKGNLDAGVLIRCIEQRNGQTYYRSGCGITHQSDCRTEYQEMIDKIYVPLL